MTRQFAQHVKPDTQVLTTPLRQTAREREPSNSSAAPDTVHRAIVTGGCPLAVPLRQDMEQRFSHDFSRVQIHDNSVAAKSAHDLGARAYTVGNHIVFGAGRFEPSTSDGRRLLAHELAHVVQQSEASSQIPPNLKQSDRNDAAEREAHKASDVISAGGNFSPSVRNAVRLAPQLDAGLPRGAPASPSPVPAAPIPAAGGSPAGGPSPAAPPRPSATFGPITFRASANRIAPTQAVDVPVTLTAVAAPSGATIDVEGSGGANGSATIIAGATLSASGTVRVRGDTQTTPGNAGHLRLRATVAGAVVGRSAGFTVAAYPINYTDTFVRDEFGPAAVGLTVQDGWSSDGSGAIAELDQVELSERVDIQHRDDPPFTSTGGTSTTGGTSGYLRADALTRDTHTYGRANISTGGLPGGSWTIVYGQLSLFKCRRTGVTDVVMPNSGFTITHRIAKFSWWPTPYHQAVKDGAAATVEGRAATAGSGHAQSPVHSI